jgi:DNA-binding protein HU-beta
MPIAMDGFVSAVSGALATGDKITLVGFGAFSVGERSQREGRNPRTGEKIKIPASKVVKFKAGKTLSEKVK